MPGGARMDEATERQLRAADPGVSTWLAANAGSGKTRVLTDRVARLLLGGTSPANILCLTYTKAAASEMQNRLFTRLGDWAMANETDLRAAMAAVGAPRDVDLARARTLFARAIETPGGLKVQTIHSFCAALLRRFPLEAGVSPQFREMDDRTAARLRADVVDRMAEDCPETIDALALHWTGEGFAALTAEIAARRDRFAPPLDEAGLRALIGLDATTDAAAVLAEVFADDAASVLRRVADAMAAGSTTDRKHAATVGWLNLVAPTLETLRTLESALLFGAGARAPFAAKIGAVPTKATATALGPDLAPFQAVMRRVEGARERRIALLTLTRNIAMHRFAQAFLGRYATAKQAAGYLDFDDLILGARDLLTDTDVAQWVLYRLDGSIDHILVDEAQDTAPAQWQVIAALVAEFAAGAGARDGLRTLFVVGDEKQSIYSFQGADPAAFGRMRAAFRDRLAATTPVVDGTLSHSFRSSAAILNVVDAVLGGADAEDGGRHVAFHASLPGRVDLWPVIPAATPATDGAWYDPVDRVAPHDAVVLLAAQIAAGIRAMIDAGTTIPRSDGTRRRLTEGDILILVQRRAALFDRIIRACKAEGLSVAGADRLRLGGELAVRDLRALLAFLATPEDDLSLACALRSPLLGWCEVSLHDLAAGRDGFLWQALRHRADRHPRTMAMLTLLRNDADFLRPYDLIDRILLRHDGRARLLGRLGPEAEDGIDELLVQALAYERTEVPSLTGFLSWLDADDVQVRRQPDAAGDRIRVMTVHGAKGLESPVVILPDTMLAPRATQAQLWPVAGGGLLWRNPGDDLPPTLRAAKERLTEDDAAERARLLYVALTRAEVWAILCGAGDPAAAEGLWHGDVAAALGTLDTVEVETPAGPGRRHAVGDWDGGRMTETVVTTEPTPPTGETAQPALPAWVDALPPAAPAGPVVVAPSGLGGAKALPGDGLDEAAARHRGTAIHIALEQLAGRDAGARAATVARLARDDAPGMAAADLLAEVSGVLDAPALGWLWGAETLGEAEISAPVPGLGVVQGMVDRLLVQVDRVRAVDFKSNAAVPVTPAAVPAGLLRQMAAYRAALAAIWPGRPVEVSLLWTRTATLMPLPDALLDRVLAGLASGPNEGPSAGTSDGMPGETDDGDGGAAPLDPTAWGA